MNNKLVILPIAVLFVLASCKKDTEVNKDTFKIEREELTASTQSVEITGSYAYSGLIDGISLELGRQADLVDSDAYRTLLEGNDFSVEVKNLRANTTYYYRYSVDYGGKTPYLTETKSFSTLDYDLPKVETKEVESVGSTRASVIGEVLSDNSGDAVTLCGVCWSTHHNPSMGDEYTNASVLEGTYTCELMNLLPEKTYYVRAFAGNSKGIAYGAELTFVTLKAGSLPEVHTLGIVGNAMLQATVYGEVITEGENAVIERGVCYGKEHYPTISGLHVDSGLGIGEYNCQVTGLEPNMTYYVRAYAINGLGVSYGEELSFVAMSDMTVPVVTTNSVKDITNSSATGSGVVVADGGSNVTRRGICWSLSPEPTVEDTHADCGVGIGAFNCLMSHLEDLTTYYVRAYAENEVGIAYGDMVSFTVGQHDHPVPPTVVTEEVNGITQTSAVGHGMVSSDGGAEVTERGICWSTSHNPTIEGLHASNGGGTGAYSVYMNDLTSNTLYYVRAYAINSVGISYGDEVSFTAEMTVTLPTVTTSEVIDITQTTAVGGGTVTDSGNALITERGVCWSTRPEPNINGNHASNGSGMGSYTVELTDLAPNMIYYVRAYATNSAGTAYGNEISFTTAVGYNLPSVTTTQVTNITSTTATGGGNVTSDGGADVTERGVCWGTSHNPTTTDSHANSGTGTGSYSVNMTNLTPNTTYYVRAYAKNREGMAYGEEVEFATEEAPQTTPSVTTMGVNNITQTSGNVVCVVTDDGGTSVTERGACWSMSHNPTVNDNHDSNGSGTGQYSVQMTGLLPATTYYVRAYAFNEMGIAYGNEISFHTLIDNIDDYLEDFETGDFSRFDWQLDADHPWTITDVDPYEGSFCMKSGGAGVANVVSNMTVTVNIPLDGEMSFFGKISCENSWDYASFYIDGVQMGSYSGQGSWGERVFDITAGTHTFQWRYTKDGSVNSGDDCFYVDNIRFYKQSEPIQPGWHTYCVSEFNNAIGSNVGTPRWAYEYPTSLTVQYAGFTMTKVSLFSDNMYSAVGGNYTCTIYRGGNEPMAGEAVSTITVDIPQNLNDWVDFDLATPVAVTGADPLWVVWTANAPLSNWPAGCCDGLVDEGTWWNMGVEAGYNWEHTTYGTWTMRQYFDNGKGRGFYNYPSANKVKVDANHRAIRNSLRPVSASNGQRNMRDAKSEKTRFK